MRAAVCREFGRPFSIEDVDVSEPPPGYVRVDVAACAICHSDIHYAAGAWGGELPTIFGHEAAGVIEAIGEGVSSVEPGQRVVVGLLRSCGACFHCVRNEPHLCIAEFDETTPFSDAEGRPVLRGLSTGAFSEQTVVHESQVVVIPDEVPFASAALLACGVLTGFGAVVNTAAMPSGSTAAVIGVGGVGLGAVQGAAHLGASQVLAIDLVPEKLEAARTFGATHAFDGTDRDLTARLTEVTDGVGPDYVFVTVGASPAIDQGLEIVRRGGTVVLVGMPALGVMTEFEPVMLSTNSQRILGSKMGSADMAVDVPMLIELYQSGRLLLDEMVTNTFPLDQINQAVAEVEAGRVIRNVIVFDR